MGLSAATALVAATGAVSSFAWFAVNGSVTATGMSIKALSTNAFLQITSGTFSDTAVQNTAAAVTTEAAELNPVALYKTVTINEGNTKDVTTAYDGGNTRAWVSGVSADVTSPTLNGHYTSVAENDVIGTSDNGHSTYALYSSFSLRLRPNATDASAQPKASNLAASSVEFTDTNEDGMKKAVRVLIILGNRSTLWSYSTGNWAKSGDDVLLDTMEAPDTYKSKVVVFFDGDDSECFTNNVVVNNSYTVKVTFTVAQ